MGKKDSRRKRHLKNIEKRQIARVTPRTITPKDRQPFWIRYSVEMAVVFIFAVAACVVIIVLKKAEHPPQEIQEIFSFVTDAKKEALAAKYPEGYQIAALFADQGVAMNRKNSFKDMNVDWKRAKFFKGKQGDLKISIPCVYEPQNLIRDLIFSVHPVAGFSSSLPVAGNMYLDMELLSIDEKKILCAFGVRLQ